MDYSNRIPRKHYAENYRESDKGPKRDDNREFSRTFREAHQNQRNGEDVQRSHRCLREESEGYRDSNGKNTQEAFATIFPSKEAPSLARERSSSSRERAAPAQCRIPPSDRRLIPFNKEIAILAKQNDIKACYRLLDEIFRANLQADAFSYNPILNIFVRSGDVQGAYAVFEKMQAQGVRPMKRPIPR